MLFIYLFNSFARETDPNMAVLNLNLYVLWLLREHMYSDLLLTIYVEWDSSITTIWTSLFSTAGCLVSFYYYCVL